MRRGTRDRIAYRHQRRRYSRSSASIKRSVPRKVTTCLRHVLLPIPSTIAQTADSLRPHRTAHEIVDRYRTSVCGSLRGRNTYADRRVSTPHRGRPSCNRVRMVCRDSPRDHENLARDSSHAVRMPVSSPTALAKPHIRIGLFSLPWSFVLFHIIERIPGYVPLVVTHKS